MMASCMRRTLAAAIMSMCAAVVAQGQGTVAPSAADRITPVPAKAVHLEDSFWLPKLEVIRTVAIPAALAKCDETGRIANFERAGAVLRGDANADKKLPANPFDDADVYKLIEAASYTLAWHPDAKLDAQLDAVIAKIAAAQEKDGYLYTARTINPAEPHALAGAERWVNEKADSFELSNLGYLYKAAVAHFGATGKRSLLDVAVRSANLLDTTFGPGKKSIWPGHEGIEAALVSLSYATGEKRYVALAKFMLDERGPAADVAGQTGRGRRGGRGNLNQSQQKVADLSTATGNALDAARLGAGMASVAAASGTAAYGEAADKVWTDVVTHKLYITGGIGSTANDGSFGRNYLLPNMSAASTTAASAAWIAWNEDMFALTGDGKYLDELERTLYNALLAGISGDGKQFFDANVLESLGRQQRREWPPAGGRRGNANLVPITVASSPLAALGTLASLPGRMYAVRGTEIFVNLFAASQADIKLPSGTTVKISQQTGYPYDGKLKLRVTPSAPARFTLRVRAPSWARDEALPGGLYGFADNELAAHALEVRDGSTHVARGYLTVERDWTPAGEDVVLEFPIVARTVKASEQVGENVGRVALQRGPLVYCLEAVGNEPAKVRSLVLPEGAALESKHEANLLGGVSTIRGKASEMRLDKDDKLNRVPREFAAVPYYAWANRGASEMLVWLPTVDSQAVLLAEPNLASKARISASPKVSGQAMTAAPNAKDGIESRSSHDNSPLSHFDWWPDRSVTVTCDYTWDQPITIKQTQAYWWDDSTTGGGCKVPASWRALYKKGEEWVPVETKDEYGVAPDKYNKVNFTPVETTALRLEIKIRDDASVGIQEWKVW